VTGWERSHVCGDTVWDVGQGAGAPSQCKMTFIYAERYLTHKNTVSEPACGALHSKGLRPSALRPHDNLHNSSHLHQVPTRKLWTARSHTEAQRLRALMFRSSVCVFAGRLEGGYGAAAPSPPGACSASAATAAGRPTTTRSLATTTRPGGAPRGLLTSLARATMTAGLPSLRALEKKAARLAAKMTSSCGASLRARRARPRAAEPRPR